MHKKFLIVLLAGAALLANACSPFVITSSSGSQPTPVEESVPVENTDSQPTPVEESVPDENTGYRPVAVEAVWVEVGTGSPIPVHVNAMLYNRIILTFRTLGG